MKSGPILDEIHKMVRTKVSFAEKDRVFSDDIEKGIDIIRSNSIINLANEVTGKKNLSLETKFSSLFETY